MFGRFRAFAWASARLDTPNDTYAFRVATPRQIVAGLFAHGGRYRLRARRDMGDADALLPGDRPPRWSVVDPCRAGRSSDRRASAHRGGNGLRTALGLGRVGRDARRRGRCHGAPYAQQLGLGRLWLKDGSVPECFGVHPDGSRLRARPKPLPGREAVRVEGRGAHPLDSSSQAVKRLA